MENYDNDNFTKLSKWENKCLQLIIISVVFRCQNNQQTPNYQTKPESKEIWKKKLSPEKLTFLGTSGTLSSSENC